MKKFYFIIPLLLTFNVILASTTSPLCTPPQATISYNSPFCMNAALGYVTFTGTTGGTFSAFPSGLSIDATSGNIQPNSSTPGIYTVIYSIAASGPDPAFETTAQVRIDGMPNSGTDGAITVCDASTSTIDLFGLVSGEQPGGVWTSGPGGTGGTFNAVAGTFTPAPGATTRTFTYTTTTACGSDTSTATIVINAQPNAGTPFIASVCQGGEVNLFSLLMGEQPGGTWTRDSGTGGIFNASAGTFITGPEIGQSIFTYTIAGIAPCASATSQVLVYVVPGSEPLFMSNYTYCVGSVIPPLETVSANGITGTWSPAIINTQIPGVTTYLFTPNAGQCATTAIVTVTVLPTPTALISTEDDNHFIYVDEGEIVQPRLLDASVPESGNFTYQWMLNGILIVNETGPTYIATQPGFYSVTVTSNIGCTATSVDFEVMESSVPPPAGNEIQTFTPGQTLADLVVSGTNIQWYDGMNKNILSTPLPLTTLLIDGYTYYATQTINGHESPSRLPDTVQLSLSTDAFLLSAAKIFPNPVNNILSIISESTITNIRVFDVFGKEVLNANENSKIVALDVSKLVSGMYLMKAEIGKSQLVYKIVKK